jgi:hypothetical protein
LLPYEGRTVNEVADIPDTRTRDARRLATTTHHDQ